MVYVNDLTFSIAHEAGSAVMTADIAVVTADSAVVKDSHFQKAVFSLNSQNKAFLNPVK